MLRILKAKLFLELLLLLLLLNSVAEYFKIAFSIISPSLKNTLQIEQDILNSLVNYGKIPRLLINEFESL